MSRARKTKPQAPPLVVNANAVKEIAYEHGRHWGGTYKPLTPALAALTARLGANISRVPPGHTGCPFHTHAREDEVFYVLAGRGVFRYGQTLQEVGPGDCISCPAGTGIAHQLGNPFAEDFIYLGIGLNDPHEVCTYPDNGKVMVRALKRVGRLEKRDYMDGEPAMPRILKLARKLVAKKRPRPKAAR